MTIINVELRNAARVQRALRNMPRQARKAFKNVLDRTGRVARTEAIRQISERVNFKKGYLREHMELRRASTSNLSVTILSRRRGTLLSRFPFRALKGAGRNRRGAGIQVEVKRGRRKVISSGFLVPLKRGKTQGAGPMGIAVRNSVLRQLGIRTEAEGGAGSRAYSVLHTTSVHNAFQDVLSDVTRYASDYFNREIQRELDDALKQP